MNRKPLPVGAVIHPSITGVHKYDLGRLEKGPSETDQLSNHDFSSFRDDDQPSNLSSESKHAIRSISVLSASDKKPSRHNAGVANSSGQTVHGDKDIHEFFKDDNIAVSPGSDYHVSADLLFADTLSSQLSHANSIGAQSSDEPTESQTTSSKLQRAFEETSHFLGGLIRHPTESTKHFSILRHNHGIVYYKGPDTSIAITVFSNRPLPADRRYWLQLKGWTGQRGMKVKALLRTNSSWVDVTPANRALSTDLPSLDERAWQRDIKKFLCKATEPTRDHTVRETAILRLPSEVTDGYFRIVLTKGDNKAVLCPSPVFRLASTSMSAGSLKGASLATLPVELGINIMQFAARQVTTNLVTSYTELAQQGVSRVIPQDIASYAPTAYSLSGAEDFVGSVNEQYDNHRIELADQARVDGAGWVPLYRPEFEGNDDGLKDPFPFTLSSKIVRGSGWSLRYTGMPTANLGLIPADQILTKRGMYFGWAFITPSVSQERHLHEDWTHAIISIDYARSEKAQIATQKSVKAYLLHNYDGRTFVDSKIEIIVMGYLRPIIDPNKKEAFFTETLRDIEITRASLEREQWTPEQIQSQLKQVRSGRSILERGAAARLATQRTIDRVPVHLLGLRTESTRWNDRGMYGNGGVFVVRDDFDVRTG